MFGDNFDLVVLITYRVEKIKLVNFQYKIH